jgi:hypothetical protein
MTARHLFLDLEDTVITPVFSWSNTDIVNRDQIQRVFNSFRPTAVSIFSFAIHNDHELTGFDRHCRPMLENFLGPITMVPRVDNDIIPAACGVMGIHPKNVDFSDASDFWSKQQSFRLWLRSQAETFRGSRIVFLDDVVWDEDFVWPDFDIEVSVRNILSNRLDIYSV